MAFDFSKLRARAAMSPEERDAHDEAQRRTRADQALAGKTLRTVRATLTTDFRFTGFTGSRAFCITEKGALEVILDAERFDEREIIVLRDRAFAAAQTLEAQGIEVGEREGVMAVSLDGLFSKRSWTDTQGTVRSVWTFKAVRVSFNDENGVPVRLGWMPGETTASAAVAEVPA